MPPHAPLVGWFSIPPSKFYGYVIGTNPKEIKKDEFFSSTVELWWTKQMLCLYFAKQENFHANKTM